MDTELIELTSKVLAALELAPAEPHDVTGLLLDPVQRSALFEGKAVEDLSPLTVYLRESLDLGRVDHWYKVLDRLRETGSAFPIVAGSPHYPRKLAQCWDAPPLLFATATVPDGPSIAIVGSRSTTPDVLDTVHTLGKVLASHGIVVVSGLAAGVDTAAHTGALAGNGLTVAVMGTGIERVYPEENVGLSKSIRAQGVLLSQFAPAAPRTGTTFLRRNRVIAALSDVSLVMDGRDRSGSRHEIEQAITYGRRALMWAPSLSEEAWANDLANRGLARFVSTVDDVLAVIGESA